MYVINAYKKAPPGNVSRKCAIPNHAKLYNNYLINNKMGGGILPIFIKISWKKPFLLPLYPACS